MPGKAFERGKLGVQSAVDPRTLGRGDRAALDGRRLAHQRRLLRQGIRRFSRVEVNEAGRIDDGHHGVRAAIELDVPVDVNVVSGDEPAEGPPSVGDMPVGPERYRMNSYPDEVHAAVVQLLHECLLRIRNAAGAGDAALCFIEADHVHNLPTLLEKYSEELLRFYLDVEREAYLKQLERHAGRDAHHRDVRRMQPLWSALDLYAQAQSARAAG